MVLLLQILHRITAIPTSPLSSPAKPPTLSADLKANGSDGPVTVTLGSPVSLTWSSTGATSCAGSGFSTSGQTSSDLLLDKKVTIYAKSPSATYVIYCSGPASASQVTDSVTIKAVSNTTGGASVANADILNRISLLNQVLEQIQLELQKLKRIANITE